MDKFLAQFMPVNASEHGPRIDHLNALVHWLMLILFVGWGLYFIYVLWKFRASKTPKASYHGTKSHLSTAIELAVLVIEIVFLVGFSIPAWRDWAHRPGPGKNPLEIRVVAEQFAWNVHYPGPDGIFGRADMKLVTSTNPMGLDPNDPHGKDDISSLNQLHLEVNREVVIHITSKDVIHSFKLPVMRAEQDAIPGMDVPIHFKPVLTNPKATWEIACAQLCGLGHYRMRGQLYVHSKEDFNKWLASAAPVQPPAAAVAAAAPPPPNPPS